MALRDTWHRTLVYFGLAEDDAYDEELEPYSEPEVELQDTYRERPNVRRLSARRRRDEIDDIFADDPGPERRTTSLRPVGGAGSGGRGNGRGTPGGSGDVRVHFVAPKNFNDVQDVADHFKDAIPVILNLQGTDTDLSKRLIDFSRSTEGCSGSPTRCFCSPRRTSRSPQRSRRGSSKRASLTRANRRSQVWPVGRPGRGCSQR
jgi:cell division inhibitor SepF